MRARNIKPGFFTDDDLVECSFAARLLYVGLWCMADRMGRLEDRPKKIKMNLFPADDVDCPTLLAELEAKGKIKRYEADGKRVIWIPGFLQHQHPHPNEKASALPRYDKDENTEWKPRDASPSHLGVKDFTPRCEALHSKDIPTQADSLNPDSLNLSLREKTRARVDRPGAAEVVDAELGSEGRPVASSGGEADQKAGPAQCRPSAGPREAVPVEPKARNLAGEFGADFQEFLEAYPPNRTAGNEVEAGKAWLSERKAKRLLSPLDMLQALDAWKQTEDWTKDGGRYVCTPQKFLAGRKYLSVPPALASPGGDDPDGSKQAAMDRARTMAMLATLDTIRAAPPPKRKPMGG